MKRLLAVLMVCLVVVTGCWQSLEYKKGDSVRFKSEALDCDFDMIVDSVTISGGKMTVDYTVRNLHNKPLDPSDVDWTADKIRPSYGQIGGGRLAQGEKATGKQVIESSAGKWEPGYLYLYPSKGYISGEILSISIRIK